MRGRNLKGHTLLVLRNKFICVHLVKANEGFSVTTVLTANLVRI